MADAVRLVTAGAVGRPHGLDGSFHVIRPRHALGLGTVVSVGGSERRVERRAGSDERPLVRLGGVGDRNAAAALGGELLLVEQALGEGEWLAADLVGCEVEGLGAVRRVIDAPSCDVLELEGGELVPLISDAIEQVDISARTISIDRRFVGLDRAGR
jgi:16S rRNA processing protein RimM